MKRFIVSILLLSSVSLFATTPLYKLSSMHTASGSERYSYTYDENLRLMAFETYSFTDNGKTYTAHCDISYDNAGNAIRTEGWNDFDGNENLNHFYTAYSYDGDNRLISYTHADVLTDGSERVHVIYNLSYNEDGLLDSVSQWSSLGVLWELKTYSYDSLGRTDVMMTYYPDEKKPDSLVFAYKNVYLYNDEGLLARNSTYKWEYDQSSNSNRWFLLYSDQYDYDDAGNCVEWRTADQGNHTYFKVVYHFDERLMADVAALPSEYIVPLPKTYSNRNIVCWEEDFMAYNSPLEHYDDYVYTYIAADETALPEVLTNSFNIFPNPADDVVYLNTEASFRIYDMNGRLLLTGSNGSADVSDLPSGIYLIRSGNNVSKLIKR